MIRLENISLGYQNKIVLRSEGVIELNASERGKVICLLGPNGSGKSTLLRGICFRESVIHGQIMMNGFDSTTQSPSQRAQQLAVVLAERGFSHQLSVMDLLKWSRSQHSGLWNRMDDGSQKIIDEMLSLMQLTDLKGRRLEQLSDGQLQRALIARALVQDTPILLMDEPTGHLDVHHRAEILNALRQYCLIHKKLLIFSSHEIALSMHFADEVLYINDGILGHASTQHFKQSEILPKMFPSPLLRYDGEMGEFFVEE